MATGTRSRKHHPLGDNGMSDIDEELGALSEGGDYPCPECGETFNKAVSLGLHRRSKHGVVGKHSKQRRRGGGSSTPREDSRKIKVRKALVDLADLTDDLRGREGGSELPATLSGVIRRDADQLATTISMIAAQVEPVRWFVDTLLVRVLAPVVGASGVLRWFLREARLRRERAEVEQPIVDPALAGEADWRGPPAAPEPLLEDAAA